MRWLFHLAHASSIGWGKDGRYAPASLETEGFIHASFKGDVHESARLYFDAADVAAGRVRVLAIDPRRLDVPVEIAETPRGPMPHVHGAVPVDAVRVVSLDDVNDAHDAVRGTRVGLVAFDGMTLLDLVGPLDAISRIASMGFDTSTSCEVVALTRPDDETSVLDVRVWSDWGAELRAARYRPALDAFDVLVVPGGPGTRSLAHDPAVQSYLASFPHNRLLATVCTGSLLVGAAGRLRGRRATTHPVAMDLLAAHGATAVHERIVEDRPIVSAGGVTAGIDLGIWLVERLCGRETAESVARQMDIRS